MMAFHCMSMEFDEVPQLPCIQLNSAKSLNWNSIKVNMKIKFRVKLMKFDQDYTESFMAIFTTLIVW